VKKEYHKERDHSNDIKITERRSRLDKDVTRDSKKYGFTKHEEKVPEHKDFGFSKKRDSTISDKYGFTEVKVEDTTLTK
jgi:hypothetical protein